MPVCRTRKLLFIHIPKNAGTSITKSLEMENQGHVAALHYKRNLEDFDEFFKFTVIRNPWDRVVSCYEFARMQKSYWHNAVTNKHWDFDVL